MQEDYGRAPSESHGKLFAASRHAVRANERLTLWEFDERFQVKQVA